MHEQLNTIMAVQEYLPTALQVGGVAAGATAGAMADLLAQRKLAQDRQAIAGELDGIAPEVQPVPMAQRAKILGKSTLVWAGAVVGLTNVVAWTPGSAKTEPPYVAIVVDQSGATDIGEESPRKYINDLVGGFSDGDYDAQAFVASNSVVRAMDTSEVASKEPYGEAKMDVGFTDALDSILSKKRESASGTERSAGIVLITNANQPGEPNVVIASAKAANIPVFIANVDEEPDPAVADNFKAIAKETEGEFWGVDAENIDKMTKDIQETLVKNQLTKENGTNPWPLRILLGGLSGALAVFAYKRRKEEPTQYKLTEEDL